jgi:hypothetical protein
MPNYNNRQKIIEHYDLVSPYYRELWGEHLHHKAMRRGFASGSFVYGMIIARKR